MSNDSHVWQRFVEEISKSNLSIYDQVEVDDSNLWIPNIALQDLLNQSLVGTSLAGLPLRTRSKLVKELVCKSMGYPIPSSFKKTQPRFPGQMFDTYVQKSNNLQIWNEEISASRRYVLIRINDDLNITRVRVVMGDTLAKFDKTGTLTQKYQARLIRNNDVQAEWIADLDTPALQSLTAHTVSLSVRDTPTRAPEVGRLIPISNIYERLLSLVGTSFADMGYDQERNRGAELHRLVCQRLGYSNYADDGQFPDIRHQLVEVKLQTSPTIDLGLVCPNSTEYLRIPEIGAIKARHCDVRYVLFYANTDGRTVALSNLYVTTGEKFFSRFNQFQGKVLNKKLQIPLPTNFFGT